MPLKLDMGEGLDYRCLMERKVELSRSLILFINIILIFSVAGCAGQAAGPGGSASARRNPALPNTGQHAAQSVLPVRMSPQQPEAPDFKSTSFAVPSGNLMTGLSFKGVSAPGDPVVVPATAYDSTLPTRRIEVKDDYLVFRPIWHDSVYDTTDDLAYCMYRVDLAAYSGASTIGFTWVENAPPTAEGKYWVGLADRGRGAWDWYLGPADSVLTLSSLAPYLDPSGELLVVIAMVGRERVVVLSQIGIGEPERRGTGVPFDNNELPDKYPPLYGAPLPGSVDLRVGCAPVNDQGTWGACTCFAVGDGAFNYELNALYEPLGWNLDDAFNRVSPKFLYVESGKLQGFPPGGDYGRYTDQVAADLVTHGVATEQNASYNLVYDDDWSPAALADAQLLTTSASYNLPCNDAAGLQTVKMVLAHQQRPVFFSTQVDWEFLNYMPGEIWHYQGPSYGGHAMLIVGYDDARQAFLVRNSWSAAWGDGGYLWVGYDTLTNPWNYYVQCGYLTDEYDPAVIQRFLGGAAVLAPPTQVRAGDGSFAAQVPVTWVRSPGATGYEIYRDTRSTLLATVGDVTAYSDTTVSDNFGHAYWVVAKQGSTSSAFSAPDMGYLQQAPAVLGVSPQGGSAGQQVRFIPTAYGSSPMNYAWDFGGGSTPNTSTESAPLVVLGDEGDYDALLTVSNTMGSHQFSFTLTVQANVAPEAHAMYTPAPGIVPFVATLDASSSYDTDGYIVLYEYDFEGDGIFDLVTTESTVTRLYDTVGAYPVKIRIMDDAGVYASTTFTLYANPDNWAPYAEFTANPVQGDPPLSVHFDADNSYDQDGSITLYEWDYDGDGAFDDSGPAMSQTDHVYSTKGTYPARLRVTDNEGATGERVITVNCGLNGIPNGWAYYTIQDYSGQWTYPAAALIDGKPAVAVNNLNGNNLEYYASTLSAPDGPEDWLQEVVDPGNLGATGNAPSLADLAGAPLISYFTGHLGVARLDSPNWVLLDADATLDRAKTSSIAVLGGKPAVAYFGNSYGNPRGLYYARATSANPSNAADWVIVPVDPYAGVLSGPELISIGDVPYIAFTKETSTPETGWRPCLARALTATPTVVEDWLIAEVTLDKGGSSLGLVNLAGRPALAFPASSYGLAFAWATTPTPSGPGDWTLMAVDQAGNPGGSAALAIVAGCPAIASYNGDAGLGITYQWSTRADPQGTSDWQTLRFFNGSLSANTFNILDVAGKPALVFNPSAANSLVYLYQTD